MKPLLNNVFVELDQHKDSDKSQIESYQKVAKGLNEAIGTLGAFGILSVVETDNVITRCQNRVNLRPVDKSKSLSEE